MPVKKKPSPAQLAARAKFVAMVRARAAAKKKAAPKVGAVKKKAAPKKVTAKKVVAKKMDSHKDNKSHNVNIRVLSGLDKITRKGKKTTVHYSRLNGIAKPTPTIQKLSKSIATDTENNDHNNAVLKLAKYLKNKDAIYMMQAIISKHKSLGHMPEELQKARNYYLKELLNQAKYKLTGSNYEAIKNSF
jgi:uncharacterized protein YjgD (DUF1641 family)